MVRKKFCTYKEDAYEEALRHKASDKYSVELKRSIDANEFSKSGIPDYQKLVSAYSVKNSRGTEVALVGYSDIKNCEPTISLYNDTTYLYADSEAKAYEVVKKYIGDHSFYHIIAHDTPEQLRSYILHICDEKYYEEGYGGKNDIVCVVKFEGVYKSHPDVFTDKQFYKKMRKNWITPEQKEAEKKDMISLVPIFAFIGIISIVLGYFIIWPLIKIVLVTFITFLEFICDMCLNTNTMGGVDLRGLGNDPGIADFIVFIFIVVFVFATFGNFIISIFKRK